MPRPSSSCWYCPTLCQARITNVNNLLPAPKSRTQSSSVPLRDSRIFLPHSARLLKVPRLAQIWVSGKPITQGATKVNNTYFDTPTYDTSAWRNLVMCQEVGHTLGLDH